MLFYYLLACVPQEMSCHPFLCFSLCNLSFFFNLVAFKSFFTSDFEQFDLIKMWLDLVFFMFLVFGVGWASWVYWFIFIKFGKFLSVI